MSDYNGWTNYETWNVNLWIENDQGLYEIKREQIEQMTKFRPLDEITGNDVQTFYAEIMGATTPDLKDLQERGENLSINYDEIAEHWEEERQEMLAA